MTKALFIRICFSDFWLSGDGRGLGSEADVRAVRDDDGWPAMPMSQIKGTLRETAEAMEKHGALGKGRTNKLFGANEYEAALAFDGLAVVPLWARKCVGRDRLFHVIASTARTSLGVAKDYTLRTIEAVAPTEIVGLVKPVYGGDGPTCWQEDLALICQWTRSFGRDKGNFGTATATCHALDALPRSATPYFSGIPTGPATLWITLTGNGDIRFTDRPSTEGLRRTLHHIPGSTFLGAASRRYAHFGSEAHNIFHMGGVRFGPALQQISESVHETIPVPASYAIPKDRKSEAWNDGILARNLVVDGRPDSQLSESKVQYEPIKALFMTTDLSQVQTETTIRTRTATKAGRAARGQLFTTEYLRTARRTFRARIDVEKDVSEGARKLLEEALAGELRLGSARSTSGGVFHSEVAWTEREAQEKICLSGGKVRVMCVSDVCIVDAHGAPLLTIPAEMIGLCGAKLKPESCVVSHRRYAKRNGHFRAMTDERLVIEAGSVLEYDTSEAACVIPRQVIGRHQQDGLGAVWINPPFLGHDITGVDTTHGGPTVTSKVPETVFPEEEPSAKIAPSCPAQGNGGVRVYHITLRTTAPLATASGRLLTLEREVIADNDGENSNGAAKRSTVTVDALLRGPDGLPTIAPRSIRGALRAIAGRRFKSDEVEKFMGSVEDENGERAGFEITWPKVFTGDGESSTEIDALLRCDTPLLRDRVAINAAGVADDRKKFTINAVPKGTIFNFKIIAPLIAADDGTLSPDPMMERLVRLMGDPEFRLGGSTTQGFGAVAVEVDYQDTFWTDQRQSHAPKTVDCQGEDSDGEWTTRFGPYYLKASCFLSIGGGAEARSFVPDGVQSVPAAHLATPAESNSNILGLLCERVINWDGDMPTLMLEFPLPGSALKGVLAHRTLYYWNQKHEEPLDWEDKAAKERFSELANRPAALTWLFGEAKDDGSGRQGALFVAEAKLDADHITRIDRVSIDRFTSGTRDETGALFAEEVLFEPTVELTLNLRPPVDQDNKDYDNAVACLEAAISDLCKGRLAVGGSGHGLLETMAQPDKKAIPHG